MSSSSKDCRAATSAGVAYLIVARDLRHLAGLKVVSAGPGKKLNLFSPAAMTEFFEELADAEATGSATPELLDEIAARCRMDVLGPVPGTYL